LEQIDTGSKHIFRFDGVIDPETCAALSDLIISQKGAEQRQDDEKMPWHDGDTLVWHELQDKALLRKVIDHRANVVSLVKQCFNQIVFPEHTTIVLWKVGKSHPRHKDNGYSGDNDILRHRIFTSITYLNEGYEGGATFVQTEHGNDYISVPKVGSTVIFPSDETAEHGVYEVKKGMRVTLPIWFCAKLVNSEDKFLPSILQKLV